MPSLRRFLGRGFLLGALIGHLEILGFIFKKNLEGPELLYALAIPCISIPLCVFALIIFLNCVARIFQKQPDWEGLYESFGILIILLLLSAVLDLLYSIFAPVSWPDYLGILLQFAGLLSSIILVRLIGKRSGSEQKAIFVQFYRRLFESRICNSYLSFLGFFLFFAIGADLWTQLNWLGQARPTRQSKPSVILIVLDTVTARHLSIHNPELQTTPFLAKLASESVVFSRAYSTSSWTLPSHASLFTGLMPHQHGAHLAHQKLEEANVTIAEIFSEQGYSTAGFIGNPRVKSIVGLGQGFKLYRDRVDLFPYRPKLLMSKTLKELLDCCLQIDNEKTAAEVSKELIDWSRLQTPDSHFIFINFVDPHWPYTLGKDYFHEFGLTHKQVEDANQYVLQHMGIEQRFQSLRPDEARVRALLGAYRAEIRYLDAQLEKLFASLSSSAWLENTVVVITSDHGEEFLEHAGIDHLMTLYEEMIHVPLLVYAPWLFKPAVHNHPVSNLKVFEFLKNLVGFSKKELKANGDDLLAPFYAAGPVFAERVAREDIEFVGMQAVIQDNWKRILASPEYGRLRSGLYDVSTDPYESLDLSSANPEKLNEMDRLLEQNQKN